MTDRWPTSVPVEHFEGLFARSRDPFRLESRWYERRKRAVTLAALERELYPSALELACAEGALTEALLERCDRLLALDGSRTAVRRASERLAFRPGVTVQHAVLPGQLPPGPFDLVVMAEVGYYLVRTELDALVLGCASILADRGELLVVHWRHASDEYPSDGDRVHERAHELLDGELEHLVEVTHPDFLIDCWRAA